MGPYVAHKLRISQLPMFVPSRCVFYGYLLLISYLLHIHGFRAVSLMPPQDRISLLAAKKKTLLSKSDSGVMLPNADVQQNAAKLEALSGVLYQIERSYGKGSIQKLGINNAMDVETTSSGSITLDLALGGGYPKGRVIEIYGPESSGKTTIALHAIAEVQKSGGCAAFVDAEHALDPVYAKKLGVNTDELLICQPDSGEMGLDVVDQLVRSGAVDIVVIDSVAALVPRAELEGDMGDTQMGLQARLMSKALRKITGALSRSSCSVIFINQLRSKIGVIYGSPEVTSGVSFFVFTLTCILLVTDLTVNPS